MTDIPETVLMKARPVLAYALTAANTGQPERALEIVARALMDAGVARENNFGSCADKSERVALAIWRAREKRFPQGTRRLTPDSFDKASGAWANTLEEAKAAIAAADGGDAINDLFGARGAA